MLRKLALSLAVSAALGVSQAHALGLGEIRVNSALNEPLDAEIKLTQVRDLSPLQIQPRLAAMDEYSQSGNVGQTRYLRDIQFQVLLTPDGDGRIRLSSSEPIQEPFLNFMVEVNWPSGRLVREYTLLLDPPVFDPTPVRRTLQPAQVQASSAESQPVAQSEQVPVAGRPASASNIRTRMDSETQVYVGNNDTLWEIASRHKPAGVSEHQMMLALLKKNPAVFPSGNINAMRAGMVMELPSADEVSQVSHREAVAEVARQMQMWREGRVAQPVAESKAPVDVSRQQEEPTTEDSASGDESQQEPPVTTEEQAPAAEGQLKIVAPQEEQAAEQEDATEETSETVTSEEAVASPSESNTVSDAQDNLEDDVLIAQERIDRLERENADLNDKLSSVLEQLEAQSRLLELQSQQMATLQTELAETATRSTQDKSDTGLLQNPALLGGIGAGVLGILAGLWMMTRRRGSDEPEKKRELVNVPEELRESDEDRTPPGTSGDSVSGAAVAAVAAGGAAVAAASQAEDSAPEPLAPLSGESKETDQASMPGLAGEDVNESLDEDLQSLDLDMDLDLNELDLEETPDSSDSVDAAEFDLSTEEKPALAPLSGDEFQSEEDGELEFEVKSTPAAESTEQVSTDDSDGLDFLLNEADASDDEDKLLEDALKEDPGFSLADDAVELTTDGGAGEDLSSNLDLEADDSLNDNGLHETVEPIETDDFEIDEDLEAMLQSAADEEPQSEPVAEAAEDDLESLLASLDADDEQAASVPSALAGDQVKEELTANISHDLEMDVDSEVDELLNSTDDEIALDERRSDEAVEVLDKMNLLSGTDETETKLDLARAYMEMDDKDGARDILNEITSEGTEEQRREAQKLLDSLS